MSENIKKILIIEDTELGFEREGGGGMLIHMFYIHVYMSKTKILYMKFFLLFAVCFIGGGGGAQ